MSDRVRLILHVAGFQLPGHQAPARRWLQDRRQHDQGQVSRGDSQDVQHHQRFHPRGGGADPARERVGRGPINFPHRGFEGRPLSRTARGGCG